MSLNHYQVSVTVTDSFMNQRGSSKTNTFQLAVLAENQTDATDLVTEFYGRTGLASKVHNGVHTLYRTTEVNAPGAVRSVKVTSISLVAEPAPVQAAPVVNPAITPAILNAQKATTGKTKTVKTTKQTAAAESIAPVAPVAETTSEPKQESSGTQQKTETAQEQPSVPATEPASKPATESTTNTTETSSTIETKESSEPQSTTTEETK